MPCKLGINFNLQNKNGEINLAIFILKVAFYKI
jgi:hypothetical protein